MEHQLFYSNSLPIVLMNTSIVLMVAAVVGFLVGRQVKRQGGEHSQLGTLQASILGLLALMLGFTFASASARYDARRILAIDEANALGTTFLRAQTLPEPYRTNLSKMLRKYVDLRVESEANIDNPNEYAKLRRQSEDLVGYMWSQAATVARKYPSDITGLLEGSLNESIDLYSTRTALFRSRVPNTIMWSLALIAATSLGLVGYELGIVGQRSWYIVGLVSLVIAVVIVMIVDLDRPETGPTRISNQSMRDLRNNLAGFEQKSR